MPHMRVGACEKRVDCAGGVVYARWMVWKLRVRFVVYIVGMELFVHEDFIDRILLL